MSGPPRHSKPPPLPRPRGGGQRFDPSQPLLDIEDPATRKYNSKRNYKPEPLLPSLELPSKKTGQKTRGLGPVAMNDPLQDATTLVSSPNAVLPMDEPLAGNTQVASVGSPIASVSTQVAQVNTQVAPAPIPPAAPTPASIVPGRSGARTATPYIVAAVLAAMTWGGAIAGYAMHEPEQLPDLATADPPAEAVPGVAAAAPTRTDDGGGGGGDEASGGEAAAENKPPPAASWTVTADATPRALQLAGATAVGSFESSVVGFANGAAAWTYEGAHIGMFGMGDGNVAVVLKTAVVGLSGADGPERFTAEIPADGGEELAVVAADANAESVLVALADARFMMITPAACGDAPAEDAGECVREVGKLSGEYLEPTSLVALGEDGMRYLAEEDALRAFDMDHKTVFEASAPSNVRSMVRVPGGRIALQFGQEAALLDPASCSSRSEVRMRTNDTQAPSGCVLWRYGRALDPVPPSAVDTSSVALNERGKLQVIAEGDDAWKIPLSSFGPVATGEGVVFTLAAEGDALALAEVDATNGTVKAKHPLAITATDEDRGDAKLLWSGGKLAASVGPHIAVVQPAQ